MEFKVLQLSHSPSSSRTLASAISSPSSKPRIRNTGGSNPLVCRFVNGSNLFRSTHLLQRTRSFDQYAISTTRKGTIRRAFSANLESFSDEEFAKKIEELALRFQLSNDTNVIDSDHREVTSSSAINFLPEFEPPWTGGVELIPANIQRKANSVGLPFSLRIIKKKLKLKEEFREVGESAYCSVKKAFSSMVFIIRELHSFSLQMREALLYEDLQGILERVQKEMHASFVWLFQQIFSQTPTLMVYVMILLANFTVHSMTNNAAFASVAPPPESTSLVEFHDQESHGEFRKFDSSSIKTFSLNGNNTASVDGGNGGGGKFRPVTSGTDGGDRFQSGTIVPDNGVFKTESVSGKEEEETKLWDSMVEEASRMEVSLDREDMKRFVSPVSARIESDDYAEYLSTELVYQTALSQEHNNPLLLANYAQFLYIVAHDYDRCVLHLSSNTIVFQNFTHIHSFIISSFTLSFVVLLPNFGSFFGFS